jgi:uncharacterized protein YdiU (UPF0061 family)
MPDSPRPNPPAAGWRLDHAYAALPAPLHARVAPTRVQAPRLVVFNRALARSLGLDPDILLAGDAAALFTGNTLPDGAQPLAQAYAGHQFGHFTNLGDGRAILLGEQKTPDGGRFDIQLKGAGPTPFSRRGDGRAALGPMLREYLISEAMHALGIPTTRSLAVAATGEPVYRDELLPGAVLTRVAASHIRVGTFEWAAAREDLASLRALADHTLHRHYPELAGSANPHLSLYEAVMERQAALVARWELVGFVHGVMNTDNMALSGETIDYGPCAFLDAYDPSTVFSSIDHHGRYAYGRQSAIAQWNLARLAEAMLPLLDPEEPKAIDAANALIASFPDRHQRHWLAGMRAKLGLFGEEPEDPSLARDLFEAMHRLGADFTHTFRSLADAAADPAAAPALTGLAGWLPRWRARLLRQQESPLAAARLMRRHNPAVIPRNHAVEEALGAATRDADLNPFLRLLDALSDPYGTATPDPRLALPPPPGEGRYRTFCGT